MQRRVNAEQAYLSERESVEKKMFQAELRYAEAQSDAEGYKVTVLPWKVWVL